MKTITRRGKSLSVDGLGYAFSGGALDNHKGVTAVYTHAVDWTAEVVLCGKAKAHMMLDDTCIATPEPSCPHCRKLLGLA